MLTPSYVLQFTAEDMRRFAGEAWGALGVNIVEQWVEFNARYFDGVLKPIPIVITNAQPYGHCLAFCSYGGNASGRTITLNFPRARDRLLAARPLRFCRQPARPRKIVRCAARVVCC